MKNIILEAAQFAAQAHGSQTRKWSHAGDPYFLHPARVAGRVAAHPMATQEMVAAAYLHDVMEDCAVTEEMLIAKGFGGEVVYFVKALTNPKVAGLRADRKKAAREAISKAPWEARLIKLFDRADNMREIRDDSLTPLEFVELYAEETKLLLAALNGTDPDIEAELVGLLTDIRCKAME